MNPKALHKIGYGMYIVSSRKSGKYNGQIANTVFQITSEPPTVAVSINKKNLTHEFIAESKAFTVSILKKDTPMKLIGTFGFKSGRDLNKFDGVKTKAGTTGIPIVLDNTLAYLEAEVIQSVDVVTHTIFIGKVVNAEIMEDEEGMTYCYYHEVKNGKAPPTAPTYIQDEKLTAETPSTPRETDMDKLTGEIIGSAIEVHRILGPGVLESSYEESLCRELFLRNIPFERQKPMPLEYKGARLDCGYRLDLLVDDKVVVEIKAVDKLLPIHEAQALTYLKLGGWQVALLINFNSPLLKDGIKRIVLGLKESSPRSPRLRGEDSLKKGNKMDKYVCKVCGYIYDPGKGDPDSGIKPGTAFEDIPDDWVCPVCGVGKSEFEKE